MTKGTVRYTEFFGLPGSGKSTIAHTVITLLNENSDAAYSRDMLIRDRSGKSLLDRGWSLFRFILCHIPLTLRTISYSLLFKPFNLSSLKYAYACVRTASKIREASKHAAKRGCSIVLFDQGVLQDLWSIGVTARPLLNRRFYRELHRLIECYYRAVHFSVIFFRVDVENAAERIIHRPRSIYRFDNMDTEKLNDMLKRKESYLRVIMESTSECRNIDKLKIDNNDFPESTVQEIYRFMAKTHEPVTSPFNT